MVTDIISFQWWITEESSRELCDHGASSATALGRVRGRRQRAVRVRLVRVCLVWVRLAFLHVAGDGKTQRAELKGETCRLPLPAGALWPWCLGAVVARWKSWQAEAGASCTGLMAGRPARCLCPTPLSSVHLGTGFVPRCVRGHFWIWTLTSAMQSRIDGIGFTKNQAERSVETF